MDATLVWLGTEAPSEDARHALDEWARARGVHLALPSDAASPPLPVDLALADRVEEDLDHARDALATLDFDGAERALARAEGALLDHPELPQAAWLMAEVMRGWAARWMRGTPDVERAARAWRAAAALDGGRVPGLGEPRGVEPPPAAAATPLALDGLDGGHVFVDGAEVVGGAMHVAAGRHAIVVTRSAATVWAAWVNVTPGSEVRASIPPVPACSKVDLGKVTLGEGPVVRADGVQCAGWVAALPDAGGVKVASCEASRCGPMLSWRLTLPASPTHEHPPAVTSRWPTWATWTLVGVGVATGTVVALAAAGTFQPKNETRFVNGGVKLQGLRGLTLSFP
jgi:hypothetical protein